MRCGVSKLAERRGWDLRDSVCQGVVGGYPSTGWSPPRLRPTHCGHVRSGGASHLSWGQGCPGTGPAAPSAAG